MIEIIGPPVGKFKFENNGKKECITYYSVKLGGKSPIELSYEFDRLLSLVKDFFDGNPKAILFWRTQPNIKEHYDEEMVETGFFELYARLATYPKLPAEIVQELERDSTFTIFPTENQPCQTNT